jgi:tetratricopeptide (TPR) repeat protein
VLALGVEGKPAAALAAMHEHLARWPRDAMVLAPATGVFGLIGFSGRIEREQELFELLQALAPHYRHADGDAGSDTQGAAQGEDWWFNMAHAFAACEVGRLDLAAPMIERSLALMPNSGHTVHVHAHVAYELGDGQAGLNRLEASLATYSREALMHCHLAWHAALFAMQLGDPDKAWRYYRESVHPDAALAPPLNLVTDSASFLWRTELAGQQLPGGPAGARSQWDAVNRSARQYFPKAGVTFADVHVALACIASGDRSGLGELRAQLAERLAAGSLAAGSVVLSLIDGLAAYREADWALAVRELAAALPDTVRIGGSRAQRDLVALTLADAQRRAGIGTRQVPGFR